MAKKKAKKGDAKKAEGKKPELAPLVAEAERAYALGNYILVRRLHAESADLDDASRAAVEALYQKTVTDNVPWLVAAGASVITIIVGLLTLSS